VDRVFRYISCSGPVSEQKNNACPIRWIVRHLFHFYAHRKGKALFMAKTRSTRNTQPMLKTSSNRRVQQRKVQRLFQSDLLTAIFGRSVGTLIMRSALTIAAIGLVALIMVGLLRPSSTLTASTSTSSSSGAPVGFQVGDAAPNFTLTTLDGKQVSLSDYRGKPVMLNFWYATCPGCQAEIPGMQQFYASQRAAGKDLVILGINSVDDAQTAQQFVQQEGMTYSVILDNQQQVAVLYNLTATPTSYFIDRQGMIRSVYVGPIGVPTLQQRVAEISG
jgi:peroxiredoxin